jgi:hypothetical protein
MNALLSKFNRLKNISLMAGITGLILCCISFAVNRQEFYISYLFSFLFWTSLSLGCFYLAMIHYLTAGQWGVPARRFLEAGFMTLPLMAIFIIPIFFGLYELYPWARPEAVAADKILRQRTGFENLPGFVIRSLVFFGIWILIASLLRKWSLRQDITNDVSPTAKMRALSGPAIAIVPLTASFAFVDWAMSTERDWSSTVFPVIILSGQMLMAIAFAIVMLVWTRNDVPFKNLGLKPFHDLGNLLLAFVMFWTYVAFSQVLIIYSANLPHEIGWYLCRTANDWVWLPGFIVLFHFFAPFILLLFRKVKKNTQALAVIALSVLAIHAVEVFWVVEPTFYPRIQIHWTDLAAWFGIGGIWCGVFFQNMGRHSVLAQNEPRSANLTGEIANAK